MKNLIGLILFDILIILSPFLIEYDKEVFNLINYFMSGMTFITLLALIVSPEDGEMMKKVEEKRNIKAKYWDFYDYGSDIIIIMSWSYFEFYLFPILLFASKAMLLIKSKG